jgi:hypothetical protein
MARLVCWWCGCFALLMVVCGETARSAEPLLQLQKGDHVVLVGNTLAERLQQHGNFETLLHSRFPDMELVVRNLGWSADEISLRPRSKDFKDHGHTLGDHQANVILAFFGFNESFAGPAGISRFEADLEGFLKAPQNIDRYSTSRSNWDKTPDKAEELPPLKSLRQIVLVSPIAFNNLHQPTHPDGKRQNENLKLYSDAMARVAAKHKIPVVDLFSATLPLMQDAADAKPLTINGVHLNAEGDVAISRLLDEALFGPRPAQAKSIDLQALRAAVNEKDRQFWLDYRAVNGFYIYGGRKAPFGIVNFPGEFAKLRKMIANRDRRIWDIAQGKDVPPTIDDSNTGENPKIETNFKNLISITPPEEAQKTFTLAEGYAINCFASEVDFPDLEDPVAFAFDNKGRLWVCCIPSYPQYLPGDTINDKILILEDSNGDGKADKQTVFADKLYLPAGIEFWNGGVIVAQQPNVTFLKDTDGDD